ncbi:MAG: dimethylsulfonioproprionate lyase family protein [Pseudomonadota bacterium]
MAHELQTLFEASWLAVSTRRDKLKGTSVESAWPALPEPGVQSGSGGGDPAVLHHLEPARQAARDSGFGDLIGHFDAASPYLEWTQNKHYVEEDPDHPFLSGYAFAMISGPDAPLEMRKPLCGYILIGPGVHYPAHHHAPREIYLVLGPDVRWQLDHGEWFATEPGDLIFHDAWQVHATKTGDAPMLAFVAWLDEGDPNGIRWAEPPE